jgi:hypothetical protein
MPELPDVEVYLEALRPKKDWPKTLEELEARKRGVG